MQFVRQFEWKNDTNVVTSHHVGNGNYSSLCKRLNWCFLNRFVFHVACLFVCLFICFFVKYEIFGVHTVQLIFIVILPAFVVVVVVFIHLCFYLYLTIQSERKCNQTIKSVQISACWNMWICLCIFSGSLSFARALNRLWFVWALIQRIELYLSS